MAQGCGWDLLVFGKSLDASGGDVALAMAAGEDIYTADGAAGTGTKVYPKEDGYITGFMGQSEDGALVNYQIGLLGEANKIGGALFQAGQTEDLALNELLGRCMKKITKDDSMIVNITNAAAKMDAIALLIGRGGTKPRMSAEPFGEIPEGAVWVEGTTAHTSTADTLVAGDISFPDYTLKRDKNYAILAASVEGATLMFWRIKAKSGPDVGNRPGSVGGDTDIITHPVYFSHPPQFVGKDGVQLQTLCHAGDTASVGMYLLHEI